VAQPLERGCRAPTRKRKKRKGAIKKRKGERIKPQKSAYFLTGFGEEEKQNIRIRSGEMIEHSTTRIGKGAKGTRGGELEVLSRCLPWKKVNRSPPIETIISRYAMKGGKKKKKGRPNLLTRLRKRKKSWIMAFWRRRRGGKKR